MVDLNKIISTLSENVAKEERETVIRVEGHKVVLYSCDSAWLKHYRKRIVAGLQQNVIEIINQDKYGITIGFDWKYLKLGFSLKVEENVEEIEEN